MLGFPVGEVLLTIWSLFFPIILMVNPVLGCCTGFLKMDIIGLRFLV